ncbi:putative cAMP-responsive element-binding protein-like 2-like [Apostichopus japonicus]|uniref:Putative cAMP-responsive element-binding protein-like 2-like n=1 Tax=Stichopus japonicus TaxID=307972 RepID=A0A2G8JMY6_STIJA|nr:putative cAMP-responsive element-binding protein-like 2-like [Apostichopus japonicus]
MLACVIKLRGEEGKRGEGEEVGMNGRGGRSKGGVAEGRRHVFPFSQYYMYVCTSVSYRLLQARTREEATSAYPSRKLTEVRRVFATAIDGAQSYICMESGISPFVKVLSESSQSRKSIELIAYRTNMTKTDEDDNKSPVDGHDDNRNSLGGKVRKQGGRKGKRAAKAIDQKTKLERSRQSARECRARKKEKYQLLEEMVEGKEKDVLDLRKQLESLKKQLSNGVLPKPEDILPVVKEQPSEDQEDSEKNG